jgi:N-acetylmuramoyl-L-alanine amidase
MKQGGWGMRGHLGSRRWGTLLAAFFLIMGMTAGGERMLAASTEASTEPAPAQVAAPTPVPKNVGRLVSVKHWSSDLYSRIVLQTTAPVVYRVDVAGKGGQTTERLVLELDQAAVAPQLRGQRPLREGLVQVLRTSQQSADKVRVEVDLTSLAEYTVFALRDPFRIVVDVRGNSVVVPEKPQVPAETALKLQAPVAPIAPAATVKSPVPVATTPPVTAAQPRPRGAVSLAQQLGLGVRTIILDPGHGGKDPGASAFGLQEKDITLKLAKKVAKILQDGHQYHVILTRSKDVFLPLEERTAIANTRKGDLFLSLHLNAHPDQTSSGIETYFLNLATDANAMRLAALENATSTRNISELQGILMKLMKNAKIDESTLLAKVVHSSLATGLGRAYKSRDLGVKQAPFSVLIGAEMPAILNEISFITNPNEAKLLKTDPYLDKVAVQLAAGIVAYVDKYHPAAMKGR